MAAAKEALNTWKEKINNFLHQKNYATDLLAKVEKKTKVDRLYIFLGNWFWAWLRNLVISQSSRPVDCCACMYKRSSFLDFRPCCSVCFVPGVWIWSFLNCYNYGFCLSRLCLVSSGLFVRDIFRFQQIYYARACEHLRWLIRKTTISFSVISFLFSK